MKTKTHLRTKRPTVLGTGLIALDVIVADTFPNRTLLAGGGTCANVLTILAFFGWNAQPIGRLANDAAFNLIVNDLSRWGVQTAMLQCGPGGRTPIIVERLSLTARGRARHKFEWCCPNCGASFPKYAPILDTNVADIAKNLPKSEVFFLDRVTRGSFNLARIAKERGATIVFEPSGFGDKDLFDECLNITDIFKYSRERLEGCEPFTRGKNIALEIQTLGADGLRFRLANDHPKPRWRHLDALPVDDVIDTAGSGDWCTAGVLHYLWRIAGTGLANMDGTTARNALDFGQQVAAINCGFIGARGAMYGLSKSEFEELLAEKSSFDRRTQMHPALSNYPESSRYCGTCF